MPENPPPPPSNLNDIESWPHGDVSRSTKIVRNIFGRSVNVVIVFC